MYDWIYENGANEKFVLLHQVSYSLWFWLLKAWKSHQVMKKMKKVEGYKKEHKGVKKKILHSFDFISPTFGE